MRLNPFRSSQPPAELPSLSEGPIYARVPSWEAALQTMGAAPVQVQPADRARDAAETLLRNQVTLEAAADEA